MIELNPKGMKKADGSGKYIDLTKEGKLFRIK